MRRMYSKSQIANVAKETASEITDYSNTIQFMNGYSNKACYIKVYVQNGELKIIVSGTLNINQAEWTQGAVQTICSFELDEETSRKLYVGNSNTAVGNICSMPGLYYNDINYNTNVVPYFIRRTTEGGNTYWIRFGGSALTTNSALTDCQFRAALAL